MISTRFDHEPLSASEWQSLFERANQGNLSARDEVISRFIPLARSKAKRFRLRYPSHDLDILSTAYAGLVDAANRFDPAGIASFGTFAATVIYRYLRDWLTDEYYTVRVPRDQHAAEQPGRAVIDAQHDPGDVSTLLASVGSFDDIAREDERRFIRQTVADLDYRTCKVIRRRFQIDHPTEDSHWAIARAMKLDRTVILQIEQRGLAILRDRLSFLEIGRSGLDVAC